ncbi:hypothetical protein AEQ27_06040 [Frigoribacterium sp. RIT-PI-h]|nr:hypothetical protein AEQ27_06040 [Frigoribacterium sp. RIT-PI-h]
MSVCSRFRSDAFCSDLSAVDSCFCKATSSTRYLLALVCQAAASLPAALASCSYLSASRDRDFRVESLLVLDAAARAFVASARLAFSFVRAADAFFSASAFCARFRSS